MAACQITFLAYVFDDDVGVELVQEFLEIRNVCLFNNGHLVCLFTSTSSFIQNQLVQIQICFDAESESPCFDWFCCLLFSICGSGSELTPVNSKTVSEILGKKESVILQKSHWIIKNIPIFLTNLRQ